MDERNHIKTRWAGILFATILVVGFAIPCSGGELLPAPEEFLGPNPGVRYVFKARWWECMEQVGLSRNPDGSVVFKESACSPLGDLVSFLYGASWGNETMSVNGSAVVSDGTVLVDLSGEPWLLPFDSGDEDCNGTCRIIARRSIELFGKQRTVLDVECELHPNVYVKWSLATGIGFVRKHQYRLVRIE